MDWGGRRYVHSSWIDRDGSIVPGGLEQPDELRCDGMLGNYRRPGGLGSSGSAFGHSGSAYADSGRELCLVPQRHGQDAASRRLGSGAGAQSGRHLVCGCRMSGHHGLFGLRTGHADAWLRCVAGLCPPWHYAFEQDDAPYPDGPSYPRTWVGWDERRDGRRHGDELYRPAGECRFGMERR